MRTGSGMSAAAAAGVSPMSGLSTEKQSAAAAAMQFPLTQRRKRRVLFTQAQVRTSFHLFPKDSYQMLYQLFSAIVSHFDPQ